ncbi:MAG: tetratricopeptide repeat protein [Bacteroidota bacterium]
MYLKGNKWSVTRRRRRPNWFRIIILSLLVLGFATFNRMVVTKMQPLGVPTATPTRPPESYVTEAQQLFTEGKLLQSIDAYEQAIAARPDDSATYVDLARVQVWAGKYKDAQESAENALLLNANNSMAHAVRAWALDFQGDTLKAESGIKDALQLDDKNGIAHAYYVEILVDSYLSGTGSFEAIDTAIEESKVALSLVPDSIEAHRARAYILEATGNYQEAIREYQAAAAINNNIAIIHLSLGVNYSTMEIYDQAIQEFTRANALNPGDPNPDLYISRTYAKVGDYAKAIQYAETAVGDNPTDPSLRGNLGVMYYHNLLWRDAVQQLSLVVNGGTAPEGGAIDAMELVPNSARLAEYYFTYGLALARLNRCGDALKIAQTINDRVPADETAITNAAEIVTICRANAKATPTEEPAPLETITPTPEDTATPEATATP